MDRRDKYHKLYSCYLKLRRVEHHANALQDALDKFLGNNPYAITLLSANFPTGTSAENTNSPDKRSKEPLSMSGSGGTANGGLSTRAPSELSKTAQ